MSTNQKMLLYRIIAGAVLFTGALLIPSDGLLRLSLFLVPFALLGWDIFMGRRTQYTARADF